MPLSHPSGTADRPTATTSLEPGRVETDTPSRSGWLHELESLIERYPWPTLLLALGLGYMISRRMR